MCLFSSFDPFFWFGLFKYKFDAPSTTTTRKYIKWEIRQPIIFIKFWQKSSFLEFFSWKRKIIFSKKLSVRHTSLIVFVVVIEFRTCLHTHQSWIIIMWYWNAFSLSFDNHWRFHLRRFHDVKTFPGSIWNSMEKNATIFELVFVFVKTFAPTLLQPVSLDKFTCYLISFAFYGWA